MINFIKKLPFKFLVVGFINTLFAYLFGIITYYLFYHSLGIIVVGILNSIVGITFSFTLFKIFVFKTKNKNWFNEYLRSYVVYGVNIAFGIFILWLSIEILKFNIFISQAFAMIFTILITYNGHKSYTFKNNE